ncbi:hypothetical protein K474DRAFT_1656214 [Panus rudis PR-1116 ss-1]|nr:hypothetical protein K474DRAFT_1667853 [Panus rudis PR-1116 ss-1]KAI0073852.1 hypothetical protein K474DRAFT_1666138 [Panus rudis PR-1116 ss-1]KAI0075260.1 hypothetical protein K474DRAFT_1664429 [Panus rudis PR-1116 ss-1]KAI0075316.1 hypothetical protein K474DRAFT_1664366 [Panus rudis PR-1116 ss-1]KAI0081814.1 hypothetical protein K474DRAFT_1656214 [Panus rudis PR-1116 ss-1]
MYTPRGSIDGTRDRRTTCTTRDTPCREEDATSMVVWIDAVYSPVYDLRQSTPYQSHNVVQTNWPPSTPSSIGHNASQLGSLPGRRARWNVGRRRP